MRKLIWAGLVAVCVGCGKPAPPPVDYSIERGDFVNLMDHRGVPAGAEDWSIMPFADQGAWFGFGLPVAGDERLGVGFTGPFLMTSGRWISPQLVRLDIPGARLVWSKSLPGILEASWEAGELVIGQTLWFDSSRTVLIRTELQNRGEARRSWEPSPMGEVFGNAVVVEDGPAGRLHTTPEGDRVRVMWTEPVDEVMDVEPGGSEVVVIAVCMTPAGDEEPDMATVLEGVDASLARNAGRWNAYLEPVAATGAPVNPVRKVAVKAVQTLIANWRGPAGRFANGGLFPSSNVQSFNGFRAWDSWKHAAALAHFAPEVAADQLRLMAAWQNESGMVADLVYLDPEEDNWRNTNPPLLGWALHQVFQATGDLELVRELYPRLVRYHEFWYSDRDHDGDGLCEYGSTDGALEAARRESGMDNAVRFDTTSMLHNGDAAWSMDQESVDLNSYLYREKTALAGLAEALGRGGDVERWIAEAERLGELVRETFFDEATGWFYDTDIDTGEIIPVQGPEGWIPLWAGVASSEQAARVRETMLDPAIFRTHVPFPTVAVNHPEFSDGDWRGPVWLDQAYFAIAGLRAYGYADDADTLTVQVLANLEGTLVPGAPFLASYDPLTGEGRNVRHFSWTAGHLLLLALEG
ncbi:MAG: trehalase family glycosidase [Thermoanaerobaculales bacterium]|jgi:putative isomerase|nr:trehalase family glycosidase [Thermoanaerobaculales bacterium]